MHVWLINELLDGEFLETVFQPEYLQKALFVVVLDLTKVFFFLNKKKQGELIDQLKKWCVYIYEKFSKLLLRLPVDKQQEMSKTQEDFLKLFDEDETEKQSEETIQLKLEMALKQGLLKVNLGVPIIFVINKSDVVLSNNTIERKKYEEDSEFINKHIRKFAITCIFL
jgi:hypothetical protein